MRTVVGLMNNRDEIQNAIHDLVNNGFQRDAISIMVSDKDREGMHGHEGEVVLGPRTEGAARGAGAGAALGGIAGLVFGLTTLAIPGLGPFFIAGPLAASITGAGVGAAAGGVIGALTKMGVPEEHAHYYAEGIKRGGMLLTVTADDDRADLAADILRRHGAVDIDERAASWRQEGWTRFEEGGTRSPHMEASRTGTVSGPEVAQTGTVSGLDEDDFQRHFSTTYGPSGERFEAYRSAYYFAQAESSNPQLRDRDWPDVEENIHQDWERTHPGTWVTVKEAIHYGWDKTRRHH